MEYKYRFNLSTDEAGKQALYDVLCRGPYYVVAPLIQDMDYQTKLQDDAAEAARTLNAEITQAVEET